jgi:ABC-type bacteriocin/lantibiotic exporter with double-glycine peptidase domain
VPLVLQASNAECGMACLAMVLGYYGYRASVRELRDVCEPGRDGISAGALVRAARRLGMEAAGYRFTPQALQTLTYPAIAHWEGNHFVVVEKVTSRHIDIVDPAMGRRRLTRAEFEAQVGRVLIGLKPGPDFHASKGGEPFWRRYTRSLLRLPGVRRLLVQVLVATIIGEALILAMPLVTQTVIDCLDELRGSSLLPLIGLGILSVTAAQLVVGLLRSSLLVHLQGRLDSTALLAFSAHLLRLPLRYFEQRSTGDIMTRFASIAMLRDLMTSQTLGGLLDSVLVVSYLGALAAFDVPVALTVAGVLACVVLLLWLTTRSVRERMAADLATQAQAQGHLVEALEGITAVKAAAAENRLLGQLGGLIRGWMTATLRRTYLASVIDSLTSALRLLTPLLVLWLCVARVLDGSMTAGTMLAITWLASSIVTPLTTVVANGQRLQLAGAQLQRLADVLETTPEVGSERLASELDGPRLSGRIDLDRVSFRYDSYSPLVLDAVSVHVGAGQRVAIVGPTGSGKTTLGMLLLGLYTPTSGEVRFDDLPTGTFPPQALRGQIGVVLQEPYVFSGTIRDNITMHDKDIPDSAVERAAQLACLHDEITAMPNGYVTQLTQRGTGLSGGQRQRLSLARALVRNPAVLLLDEATSHLDSETEARIHRNLADLRCVQVVIAHRLSTVCDADQIMVLHGGEVAEAGTHQELLSLGGRYATLVAAQLDGHDEASSVAQLPIAPMTELMAVTQTPQSPAPAGRSPLSGKRR